MKQKVWISKYALSGGIKEYEAEIRNGSAYPGAPFMSFTGFVLGKDAHLTRDEAVVVAEDMRRRKIASLTKQLSKLEILQFN